MKTDHETAHALVRFVDGAALSAKGDFLREESLQEKGSAMLREAYNTIVRNTGSDELLIPLLQHDNPGVRLRTATMLIDNHYDLVLPTLHELDETSDTEAGLMAGVVLQLHGEPNRANGFKKPEFTTRTPQPRALKPD